MQFKKYSNKKLQSYYLLTTTNKQDYKQIWIQNNTTEKYYKMEIGIKVYEIKFIYCKEPNFIKVEKH